MKSINFSCQVISPMFLNGPDGSTPELRPPSIKGALRFWWRAINGHLSLAQLHEHESKIFGGTDEKIGRSKVLIQLVPPIKFRTRPTVVLPHRDRAWSNLAIATGETFSIKLSLTQPVLLPNKTSFSIEQLESLFILMATLGGLGKRVRRGFGSFTIQNIEGKSFDMPLTPTAILAHLQKLSIHFSLGPKGINFNYSSSSCAYPFIRQIEIGQPAAGVEALIKKISRTSHLVKEKDQRDNLYQYEASLGHARNKKRFASPIFVSVIGDGATPIISSLNTVPEQNEHKVSQIIQETFKNKILYKHPIVKNK